LDFCSQEEEVFIIGGAQLYEQSINKADFLYITHIHSSFQGADVFFPSINSDEWVLNSKKDLFADEKNLYDYSFLIYTRK
jgi:dihydrofolate reductase